MSVAAEKKYRYLQEVTVWAEMSYRQPNHIYVVDKETGKLVGYIREGSVKETWFKKPMQFDRIRRKFVDLSPKKLREVLS